MSKLREMRSYWRHEFETQPVRATFALLAWFDLIALGAFGLGLLVYAIFADPPDDRPPGQPERAAPYGNRSTFMTDEERLRADERNDDIDEEAEHKVLRGVASALPDPPGAKVIVSLAGSRREGFETQLCMPGDPRTAAALMDAHYTTIGWAIERHEDALGRWVVSGKYAAVRFTVTPHPVPSGPLSCSGWQTYMVLRVAPW